MPPDSDIPDRIARIAGKVREKTPRLGPCLTEQEIWSFESRHGITLPAGYRQFLLHVGDGGPGPPDYGLMRLGEITDLTEEEVPIWGDLPHVGKPFPFTRHWVWEGGDESEEGTEGQVDYGSIYLGTDGCAMNWHLIVTGPERGNVWMICGEGICPTDPKRDFLRWFEDWLDGVQDWWA